jgi:hypothetical protein
MGDYAKMLTAITKVVMFAAVLSFPDLPLAEKLSGWQLSDVRIIISTNFVALKAISRT